jgi:transcriptional regulator with XRE-family HTH domain
VAVGLSQEELAERAGLSRRGISDLERGTRRAPYPATVRRLAEALSLNEAERAAFHVAAGNRGASLATLELTPADGAAPRQNLPAQLSSFVGREQEVATARQLLAAHRLVTLTGPGGSGKTRLALAVAQLVPDAFADGVFFVSLAAVGDPGLVMATIGQTLGLREVGERPMLEILRVFLSAKCVLLVLDNLEHLLGAVSAVAELVGACPRLRVLATSEQVALRDLHTQPCPRSWLTKSTIQILRSNGVLERTR